MIASGFTANVGRRLEDRDLAKRVQSQEVRVPSHDDVGTAVNGGLEELVVIGVAARTDLLHDLHDFDERR